MAKRKAATTTAVTERSAVAAEAVKRPSSPPLSISFNHYIAIVPLQTLGILFSLLAAAQSNAAADSAKIRSPGAVLDVLSSRPLKTIALTTAGVLAAQLYAGISLRNSRQRPISSWKGKSFSGVTKSPIALAVQALQRINLNFLRDGLIITLVAAVAIFIGAVLLGAPLAQNTPATLLLSLLVAILAVTPLAIVIPTSEQYVWLRLSALRPANDLEIALLYPLVGTLVGAWTGAIPLPLDWNAPWQTWPTTCVLGSLFGQIVGSIASLITCSINASTTPIMSKID